MALWNISGARIDSQISASAVGDNILVPAQTNKEIFIHEVIGDTTGATVLTVKAGTRVLGKFNLDANQGLMLGDPPGMEGEPRFRCYPGEAFIFNLSVGTTFEGAIKYSFKE